MTENIQALTFTDDILADHDTACTIQAGRLLSAGCLEYEIAAYASAVYVDDEIYYYITAREDNITKFVRDCYLKGLYPTPIKYYCKRYDLMEIDEDKIRGEFRLELALRLKEEYPIEFFEKLEALTKELSTNTAMPIINALMKQLDSCFDAKQLKIFESLLDMLLPARHISLEGYEIASRWLAHEYNRLAIEPTKSGHFQKNYASFAYQKPNEGIKYFCDAFAYIAKEKQGLFLKRGYLVSPILESIYFADSYVEAEKIKGEAKDDVMYYLDENYMNVMRLIRKLPPTVNKEAYNQLLEEMKLRKHTVAADTLKYYG